jgi:trehalose/maltose hydrolase-like predicted phosphorylase
MNKYCYKTIVILFFVSFLTMINAQDSSFIFKTASLSNYFPGYIGNGNFSLSTTKLGTNPSESYMAWVYDHAKDDIARIAKLPAWNTVDLFDGSTWLNATSIDENHLKSFHQQIDMSDGVIETSYEWKDGEKLTKIEIQSFVSRNNPNAAAIKFTFTPEYSGKIKLKVSLSGWNEPKRQPLAKLKKVAPVPPGKWPPFWYPGFMAVIDIKAVSKKDTSLLLVSKADGGETFVAETSTFNLIPNAGGYKVKIIKDKNNTAFEIEFNVEKNKKYTLYKYVSVVSSQETPNYVQKSKLVLKSIKQKGYKNLFNENKKEWAKLWQTDIIIKGNNELQKIIHSDMFYLMCSAREGTGFSIAPMGLATSGYFGHIFWDADTYMFPPLLFMHPGMAKSMVKFRFTALKSAVENAALNNLKGAMYPWESDELGKEATPFFAYQNALGENHIVGDVALAQWQYFLGTGDTTWLREFGSKVIFATADFWLSRVSYNKEKDRYEIGNVVSVSEGLTDLSNETYTNSIAKINLELAIRTSNILGIRINPQWFEVSKKMFIPYNAKEEYHPVYGNAKASEGATELWSSVTPLLTYPLQMKMSENAKRNDFMHAVESLKKNGAGANMGTNFLPIIAAELNQDSLFNFIINKTLKGYLRPPFNVLAETHDNNSINFLTGAGAFLQQVIFGYTGLRLDDNGLVKKFDPMLPDKVSELTLKNFTIRGKTFNIIVKGKNVEFIKTH